MVNGLRIYWETDGPLRWLVIDNRGLIGLPIWSNRETTQGTFQRFTLTEADFTDDCWVTIKAPAPPEKPAKATAKRAKK